MKVNEYDVIIIGASNSGGMAACAAAEKGAKVLVIDKMKSTHYLYRLSLAAVGTKAQKKAGIDIDKYQLINYLCAFAQDNVDQKLLWTWVNNSAATVDWLEDNVLKPHGAHLYAQKDAHYQTLINTAFPTEHDVTNKQHEDIFYGNWVIEKAQELGADFLWQTKLEHLITENGVVTGLVAKKMATSEVLELRAKKGVIICTGGYGSNEALMQKWNPLGLKKNVYSDSPRDDGSGQLAAVEIGAWRDEEPAEIIFDRGAVPVGTNTNDYYVKSWEDVGYFWLGSYPLLKLNLNGERVGNESAPYEFDMNRATKQPGYLQVALWDDATMNNLKQFHTLGCARLNWPGFYNTDENKEEINNRVKEGFIQKANSIAELAQKLHLPVENVQNSVASYNQMCEQGRDTQFGKEDFRLVPIKTGAYYGAIYGGRLLATLDGLRINTKMQVLNTQGQVIPHLYAAGNASGGFFWGSYPDHVPGLTASHAQTFGRLAGQQAAN